jgi:hypothetical protein
MIFIFQLFARFILILLKKTIFIKNIKFIKKKIEKNRFFIKKNILYYYINIGKK